VRPSSCRSRRRSWRKPSSCHAAGRITHGLAAAAIAEYEREAARLLALASRGDAGSPSTSARPHCRSRVFPIPISRKRSRRMSRRPSRRWPSPAGALLMNGHGRNGQGRVYYPALSLTRISSAGIPSTAASTNRASAPCRTSAFDQRLCRPPPRYSAKTPQTLIISL
jgi:hypothetical protein